MAGFSQISLGVGVGIIQRNFGSNKQELWVQNPVLTCRAMLFSMSMEKRENFRDFITRNEMQACVCNIEEGLMKGDILLLCIYQTAPQETCTKVLQFFIENLCRQLEEY